MVWSHKTTTVKLCLSKTSHLNRKINKLLFRFSKPEVRVRTKNNMNFTTNFTRITNMWFFCSSNEYLLNY
jgi:hypothetical protein